MNLDSEIKFQNFIMESVASDVNDRPIQNLEYIRAFYTQEEIQKPYPRFPHLTPKEAQELTESSKSLNSLLNNFLAVYRGLLQPKYPTLFDLPYKH
jgi:hypothetical protein